MALERTEIFTPELAREMAELHRALAPEDRTVFHDPFFLLACWRSAPPAARPFALVRRGPGGVEGAAFFRHDTARLAGRAVRCVVPLTSRVSDFTPFPALPALRPAFIGQVLAALQAQPLPVVLPLLREAESRAVEAHAAGGGWTVDREVVNPVVLARDLAFARIASKKSLRVATNQMGRMGRLEITHRTSGVTPEMVDELRALHRERWAFDGSPSKLAEPFFQALYHALCRDYPGQAAEGCGLVYSAARLDGEAVAVHLGLRWGTTFLYHIPATNLAYLDASPGQVLLRSLFERAAAEGVECFDLGFGEDPYKDRYATERRVYRNWVRLPTAMGRARHRAFTAAAGALAAGGPLGRLRGAAKLPGRLLRAARGGVRPSRVRVFSRPGAAEARTAQDLVELTFADLVRLARGPDPFPYVLRRRLLERFREGYRCFALRKEGRLVSFAWAVVAPELRVAEARSVLRAGGDALWITDCATPERFRGRGHYPELLRAIHEAIPASLVLIYCVASNEASARGILKAGFAPAGDILRFPGVRRLVRRPRGAPPLGLATPPLPPRAPEPPSAAGGRGEGSRAAGGEAAAGKETAAAGGRS